MSAVAFDNTMLSILLNPKGRIPLEEGTDQPVEFAKERAESVIVAIQKAHRKIIIPSPVGRPTKWGNPFIVGKPGGAYTAKVADQRHAWQLYRSVALDNEKLIAAARSELRGKNLACFCPLPTQPYEPDCCHAAVLLELANSTEEP